MQKNHPESGPEKQVSFICTALAQEEFLFAEYLWKTLLIFHVSEQFHKVGLRSPCCKKQDRFRQAELPDAGSSNTLPSAFITSFVDLQSW